MIRSLGSGFVFGLAAVVVFTAAVLLATASGGASITFGLVVVALLGWGAGFSAARSTRAFRGQGVGRGLAAGITGGTVALIGSVFAGVLFASLLGQRIDVWLQRISRFASVDVDFWPYVQGGGVAAGLCLGFVNFLLMAAGGALGGWMWRR